MRTKTKRDRIELVVDNGETLSVVRSGNRGDTWVEVSVVPKMGIELETVITGQLGKFDENKNKTKNPITC